MTVCNSCFLFSTSLSLQTRLYLCCWIAFVVSTVLRKMGKLSKCGMNKICNKAPKAHILFISLVHNFISMVMLICFNLLQSRHTPASTSSLSRTWSDISSYVRAQVARRRMSGCGLHWQLSWTPTVPVRKGPRSSGRPISVTGSSRFCTRLVCVRASESAPSSSATSRSVRLTHGAVCLWTATTSA